MPVMTTRRSLIIWVRSLAADEQPRKPHDDLGYFPQDQRVACKRREIYSTFDELAARMICSGENHG
jgi:hypothetical protein